MKALDRIVETLGLRIVTSSITFIKSANQSSIKLCQLDILRDVIVQTFLFVIRLVSQVLQVGTKIS